MGNNYESCNKNNDNNNIFTLKKSNSILTYDLNYLKKKIGEVMGIVYKYPLKYRC